MVGGPSQMGLVTFSCGQGDPSLGPSFVSARARELRQGRDAPCAPLLEQARAGTCPRLHPPHSPAPPGEKFAHLILRGRRGTVSQAGNAAVGARRRNSRARGKLAGGGSPFAPPAPPGAKDGGTGDTGTPEPWCHHPALSLQAGPVLGCPGGAGSGPSPFSIYPGHRQGVTGWRW